MGYRRSVEDKRRGKKNINKNRRERNTEQRVHSSSEVWICLSKEDLQIARLFGIPIENGAVKYDDWSSVN